MYMYGIKYPTGRPHLPTTHVAIFSQYLFRSVCSGYFPQAFRQLPKNLFWKFTFRQYHNLEFPAKSTGVPIQPLRVSGHFDMQR